MAGYRRIDEVLADTRLLYNAALEERKTAWKGHRVSITYYDQTRQLTQIRADDPDGYGAISVQVMRGPLDRLNKAFDAFFARVKDGNRPGYPRFKTAQRWRTIDTAGVSPSWFGSDRIRIKGLPDMRLRRGRTFPDAKPVALKLTRKGRRLTASITYEMAAPPAPVAVEDAAGIDMGVTDRLALSDGRRIGRRKRPSVERITAAQRRLSSSKRGSRTRRKRAAIFANLRERERIANRNEVHRMTTAIVRRYRRIAVEDLAIKNMIASAAGTQEEPGTNVAAKRGLNRSIQEQTWGLIRQQLAYKAAWAGREFKAVNPQHTSQRCSECGLKDANSRRGKRYVCGSCGMVLDADVNAARNILRAAGWKGVSLAAETDLDTSQKSTYLVDPKGGNALAVA